MMAAPDQRPLGDEGLAWYVVHTHSRHEAKVEWGLQARGLEVFLPRITSEPAGGSVWGEQLKWLRHLPGPGAGGPQPS